MRFAFLFPRVGSVGSFRTRLAAAATLFFLIAPSVPAAVPVNTVVTTPDTQAITRGDFLRAAVKALSLPENKDTTDLPYDRVPSAYLSAVRTAYDRGALKIFGNGSLSLEKSITRGEALYVLSKLAAVSATKPLRTSFTDVKADSPYADGVAVAVERSWLRPLRGKFFGVQKPLTGRDAKLLLSRVMPKENPRKSSVPLLRVNVQPDNLPKEDVMKEVWKLLNNEYLYQDRLDSSKAGTKAVQGMVESLKDPYTIYLQPSSAENFQTMIKGEVEGIGATVEQTGGLVRIVSPLRGSPAEKAGLQPRDIVLSANGVVFEGLNLDEAVSKIRGPKGTTVVLKIRRDGKEFDVSVVRDTIKIPEVEITEEQGGVWLVRLVQFGQTTDTRFREEIAKIYAKHPRGIVLDLRSNPGGLLDAAGVVVSAFEPNGTTYVSIRGRNETYEEKTKGEPQVDASVRLAVIVNKGSASASEIVAGALQDLGRATIVGEKSFGKGTVQQLVQFSDGSSLKFTVAEWFTPKGRKIDGLGITPDILVQETKGSDAPLKRAIELVR